MAKKTRNKSKSKNSKKERLRILEYNGFSAGEEIWAIYLGKTIIQGTIIEFHPADSTCPSATIMTPSMGYRTVSIDSISRKKLKRSDINNLKN